MPSDSNEMRLAEIFSQCAAEMLVDLGAHATNLAAPRPSGPTSDSIAAFVPFGNGELRGSLTLQAPRKLFSLLHPLTPPTTLPHDLDDWACEMANQAVGRFRNRLASYAVKVTFGVPQNVPAEPLPHPSEFGPAGFLIAFAMHDMVLCCWLELETQPDFWLEESPMEEIEKALQEGTLVLF
jgi:hypothetical protein